MNNTQLHDDSLKYIKIKAYDLRLILMINTMILIINNPIIGVTNDRLIQTGVSELHLI